MNLQDILTLTFDIDLTARAMETAINVETRLSAFDLLPKKCAMRLGNSLHTLTKIYIQSKQSSG